MSSQSITKALSVGALALLAFAFSVALLLIAAPMFMSHGVFVFAVSSRAFTVAIVTLSIFFAVVLFFLARAFRRRHLN